MLPAEPPGPETATVDEDRHLGRRIRALRRSRRLTLLQLANRASVSESFLSQVERGVTSPSIASLRRIARGLDLTIAQFFEDGEPAGRIVRREHRRRVTYPGLGAVDEFLTATDGGRLQVILSTIEAGGGTGDEPYVHESDEEVVVVLEGELDLWVADEHHHLREGDAIAYSSRLPHRNTNRGTEPARVLFCMTPPSF